MKLISNAKLIFISLALFTLVGCKATSSYTHHTVQKPENKPVKLLVMPVEIAINTLTASGNLELEVDATEKAKVAVQAVLHSETQRGKLELLHMPPLNAEEDKIVREHVALYDTVGGTAINFTPIFAHKRKNFDYTLGDGLAFLKERTGADAALFVNAYNTNSSGGRVAAATFAAMWGVAIPMGVDYSVVSIVDLETGNILWLNKPAVSNLQKDKNISKFSNRLFEEYEKSLSAK